MSTAWCAGLVYNAPCGASLEMMRAASVQLFVWARLRRRDAEGGRLYMVGVVGMGVGVGATVVFLEVGLGVDLGLEGERKPRDWRR